MFYLSIYTGLIFLRSTARRAVYYALLMALFLFSAFRFEVGCDWQGYLHQFRVYSNVTLQVAFTTLEPLWTSFFVLQRALELPYPWINVFACMLFFAGIHALAKRQPNPVAFLVLLFPILIINMPMSGIRQAAAIGLICFAFLAFLDRRLIWFIALTLLASLIHSSAIIFLLLTPLVTGRYSKRRIALAGLLAVPGAVALMGSDAAELATGRYLDTGIDAAGAIFRVGLLAITGAAFFSYFRKKWQVVFPQDYKLVSFGAIMMIAMIAIVPISSVIGDRFGYYLIPVQTMIFARIPYLPLTNNRNLFIWSPYVGLFIVFAVWSSRSWIFDYCYLPYQTWLFGFPDDITFIF